MDHPSDPEPGILAGEPSGIPVVHDEGFLSFHTGDLGAVTVLGAKLRLRQATTGTYLGADSTVDINNGSFGSSGLGGMGDFSGTATSTDVFPILDVGSGNWFEVNLTGDEATRNVNVSTTSGGGETQFRISLPDSTAGQLEGWYSGDSADYPPQLLVRYQ